MYGNPFSSKISLLPTSRTRGIFLKDLGQPLWVVNTQERLRPASQCRWEADCGGRRAISTLKSLLRHKNRRCLLVGLPSKGAGTPAGSRRPRIGPELRMAWAPAWRGHGGYGAEDCVGSRALGRPGSAQWEPTAFRCAWAHCTNIALSGQCWREDTQGLARGGEGGWFRSRPRWLLRGG